jgi:hypothetical protein
MITLAHAFTTRGDFLSLSSSSPFLDGDIPLTTSKDVYILVEARICSNVSDFNDRNLVITYFFLHWWYRFLKLLKTVTKCYYRCKDLVYQYNSTCIDLIKKGISHPCFYDDVINKVNKCSKQYLSPLTLRVRIPRIGRCTRYNIMW